MCPSLRCLVAVVLVLLLHALVATTGNQQPNLLKNHDFEYEMDENNDWKIDSCVAKLSWDKLTGNRSVYVRERTKASAGVIQKVYNVSGDTMYFASAYVKIINDPNPDLGALFYQIRLSVNYKAVNQESKVNTQVARLPNIRRTGHWHFIGGDITIPDVQLEYLEVGINIKEEYIEYKLDNTSLVVIPKDPNWKANADAEILKHRTSKLTVNAQLPKTLPYCQTEIQVDQVKRDFGFGVAVQSDLLNNMTNYGQKFRSFVTENFNWVTFANCLKWKPMEPVRGEQKKERVDRAIAYLRLLGMKIRLHSLVWGFEKNNADWVLNLNATELEKAVNERTNDICKRFSGIVEEYDVYNEWLHGTWYENKTGNEWLQRGMFTRCRNNNPTARLITNDYQLLRSGDYTSAAVKQVEDIIRGTNNPNVVNGIGAQSHLRVNVPPELLSKRLDVLSMAGKEISITEMSVHSGDINERAQMLDTAFRIYFSKPMVHLITFWYFSDLPTITFEANETLLFEGEDFKPNVAGQVLLDLLNKWQTHEIYSPDSWSFAKTLDAYHGSYEVKVVHKGRVLLTKTVDVKPYSPTVLNIPESELESIMQNFDVCKNAPAKTIYQQMLQNTFATY